MTPKIRLRTMFCKKILLKNNKTKPAAIKLIAKPLPVPTHNAVQTMKNTDGNICLKILPRFNDFKFIRKSLIRVGHNFYRFYNFYNVNFLKLLSSPYFFKIRCTFRHRKQADKIFFSKFTGGKGADGFIQLRFRCPCFACNYYQTCFPVIQSCLEWLSFFEWYRYQDYP